MNAKNELFTKRFINTFKYLNSPIVKELAKHVDPLFAAKRTSIYNEGDPASYFYFTLYGIGKLSRVSADGNEQVFDIFGPGSIFGWDTAFLAQYHEHQVTALNDMSLARLSRQAWQGIQTQLPEESLKIMQIGFLQGRRLLEEDLLGFRTLSLSSKLSRFILNLSITLPHSGDIRNGFILSAPLTHQLIGNRLGVSREAISRELAKMERDGLVLSTRKGLVIKDYHAMVDIANQTSGDRPLSIFPPYAESAQMKH